MKKIVLMICAIVLGVSASMAQANKGDVAVGVNLGYGSLTKSLGLGARFQYGIIDNVRAEVSFNSFLEHNHVRAFDVNLNAHYMVGLYQDRLYLYPLAGLNYTMATYKEDGDKHESNHIGLNLGAGLEYGISERVSAFVEYRHTIIRKVDQGIFMVGAKYRF